MSSLNLSLTLIGGRGTGFFNQGVSLFVIFIHHVPPLPIVQSLLVLLADGSSGDVQERALVSPFSLPWVKLVVLPVRIDG